MSLKFCLLFAGLCSGFCGFLSAQSLQDRSALVNVFLGSSGDHGQLSPAASSPFSMLSIGAQTYPHGHTGYEYKAKMFLGFTHTRFEGVGCEGSGGNLLITPVLSANPELIKVNQSASPGRYAVSFTNGVGAVMRVAGEVGEERYHFPLGEHGFRLDLSHTLANRFVAEEHHLDGAGCRKGLYTLSGWIESGTTCDAGVYRIYYALELDQPFTAIDSGNHILLFKVAAPEVTVRVALSSVSVEAAKAKLKEKMEKENPWNSELAHIRVKGDGTEEKLFYSLLYRVLQSPYQISERDGFYRAVDGSLQHADHKIYHGWSIWDNYKTQLPLLSLAYGERYQDIMTSLAGLYRYGKKNWAGLHEPSNTVRTEHAVVVLLDAYRKGYSVDFKAILEPLTREMDSLSFKHPDKALESCYDLWAMSQILGVLGQDSLSKVYVQKAMRYQDFWKGDFKDLSKKDIDELPARGMYQGTIWQYRWMVPYDIKGLMALCGGEEAYISQLDGFFNQDYYNAANEPDIQVPYLYSGTSMPWKSQQVIRRYAADTVVQYYYNDNSRGVDPFIGRVFNNRPDGYVRTMDDDGGAMSGWYVLAAIGLSPACVGWPVWYVHVPLFSSVQLDVGKGKSFKISVKNFDKRKVYITSAWLNGKKLERNWLRQSEIATGGELVLETSDRPDKTFGIRDRWISAIQMQERGKDR